MKLKNDIKKYMTLGAALAASTFMVSCDGDDGKDGVNGIDGNSPNLPIVAPHGDLLSISELTLTVNSAQGTFTQGQQMFIEFDSTVVARSEADINDNINTPLSLGVVSDFKVDDATPTRYTLNYKANDGTLELTNLTLQVTSSKENSILGTWSADGIVANPTPQVVTVGGVDNANFITASNGGANIDTDSVQGFRVVGTNVPVFSFADGTSFTLTPDLEAILVSADNFGGNANDSFVFVRALSADAIMEIGDPTALDPSQRYTDGAPTNFEVIAIPGVATPVTGAFEHIIQGSTNGQAEDEQKF